jgi:amino acid adenylation domain-containing protein
MDDLAERLKSMTPLQRAVFALKETKARLEVIEQKRDEPIAIVGMACRFPGGAHDPASYWQLLCDRVDAIGEVPADRWDAEAFYDPDPAAPGKMTSRCGGFLTRIDEFDNHFFGISDREAPRIDPQQRLLLELGWEVLEDAGIPPSSLRGAKVGVFIGISNSEYGMMLSSDPTMTDAHAAAGTSLCLAANRLSFVFGLQGPSMSLDTACSSSLVALHLGCQHIRNGDCDAALVGGVNLLLSPIGTVNLTKAGFCAADGRVRAFDAAATGYVRSEGAALVMLKPLSAAIKDNDPIYALIRGSAVNQNGSSNGLTAPSRAAQELVLREAYARAHVSPGEIQYVETQGTGTRLGDAIEATALGNVLRDGRPASNRCAIGSVKTNIGHLEAAAGMAGLIKTSLALKHRLLPPNLHFHTPNPEIPFDCLPLTVQSELEPWPSSVHPRLGGVSAFGFGGSNSHVVLQEAPPSEEDNDAAPVESTLHVLPLSARTEKALDDLAGRYAEFLANDSPCWHDICFTAARRREHHDCRLAVLADSPGQAIELLKGFSKNESQLDFRVNQDSCVAEGSRILHGRKPYGRDLKIAFLYSDQPQSWKPLLSQRASLLPAFATVTAEIDAALQHVTGGSLAAVLSADGQPDACALVALQLALSAWWRSIGISPNVVLGHGIGELAAASTAGILSVEDVLRLASGGRGGPAIKPKPASLPLLSTLGGRWRLHANFDPAHEQSCFAAPRELTSAFGALADRQADVWLEIGPQSLAAAIAEFDGGKQQAVFVPSLMETQEGRGDVRTAIGILYTAGADLQWPHLTPAGRCVRVPTYPWQRQRLWALKNPWQAGLSAKEPQAAEPARDRPAETTPHARPDLTTPYVAPRNDLEESLARSWSTIFAIERIGVHDNFFELGGHSLMAIQAVSQIADQFQIELPLREMFETPTIAALAERITSAVQSDAAAHDARIVPIPRDGHLPLSLNQEALWFLDRLEPERPTYMLHLALNVRGPVDIPALEQALLEIERRHEVLRTTFPEVNGSPVQVIAPPKPRRLPIIDLSHLPPSQREEELRRRVAAEMSKPIDLQEGPLFRLTMLRRAEDDYTIVASTHHIIHDGWSMGILLGELGMLYPAYASNRPLHLPALPIQYVDFAAWQRRLLQGENLERLRAYWRRQLADVPALELPTDAPRPAVRATRGSARPCRLSPETSAAVVDFCRREGVTPFMTLLAAFQTLLARYSGQDDFAIGAPVANRNRPETARLIGYFVNVVVLRANLAGDPTFREAVARARQTSLDAFERQEMTLDQVVDAVKPPRDLSRNPLFQVMFALQNIALPAAPEMEIKITPLNDSPAPPSANFDLTLELFEREEGFQGSLSFSTDLFLPETIDRMAEQFEVLVAAAVRQPDQTISALPLLEPPRRQEMLVRWNATARDYDRTRLVYHLFEDQARRNPATTAIVADERRWTYEELNQRADRLARCLQRQGVGPEVRVGVCLERSPELLMTVLGVMKAGGAYVPLDPAYTRDAEDRIQYVLEDAGVSLVVTNAAIAASLKMGESRQRLLVEDLASVDEDVVERALKDATVDNLAYILYTSGSTGRPKGVMVTHGNLLNAYHGWREIYGLGVEIHSHLQMAGFAFDVFGGDMVRALCSGGKLVLCRKEILLDAAALCDLIRREKVEAAEFVPIVFRNLVQYLEETGQTLDELRLAIAGSDAWFAADHCRAQRVFGPQTRLLNTYGLTETTIDSSYFEGDVRSLGDAALVPIGQPFPNVQLHVLDGRMEPVPIGVPGELYIGGDGVSRGYVDPRLSAERFIINPFACHPDARLCRSGDRARRRVDGQIEFLGRADNQVKIRGFRVEPGEVEQLLRDHPALSEAVVVARPRTAGDVRLVAYVVVAAAEAAADFSVLQKYLAQHLPDYMVPSTFVALASLPTTISGKVDRKALPEPNWGEAAPRTEFVAPRTQTERQLAAIWSELLNIERVGAEDDFFAIGGNSLLALRFVARVRQAFSVDLPLVNLFMTPRLDNLAEQIDALHASGPASNAPPIRPRAHDGPLPISITQERYWDRHHRLPGDSLLNIHAAFSVAGELDIEALQKALNEIVRRHEALRTRFVTGENGQPMPVIAPDLHLDLPINDLSSMPADRREEEVNGLSREQASAYFDLGALPLFRLHLLRLGRNQHVILATMHHIISDGWSVQVLFQEVAQLYDAFCFGHASPLPELPIQYVDYALWQREYLQGETLAALAAYWQRKLAGWRTLPIPTDRPRQAEVASLAGFHDFHISAETRLALERLGRRENATMFMLLMAAYQVLLRDRSGKDDVPVIFNTANRNRRETQGLIGVFTNRVCLRGDLSGDPSFRDFLARTRLAALEAFAHQDFPVEFLLADNPPQPALDNPPGVQAALTYDQRAYAGSLYRHRGLDFRFRPTTRGPMSAHFDLWLTLIESDHGLIGEMEYDSQLFDDATIQRLDEQYLNLLEEIVANPEQRIAELSRLSRRTRQRETTASTPVDHEETGGDAIDIPLIHEFAASLLEPALARGTSLAPLRAGGDHGAAPALFCIHGLGGHIAAFMPLAQTLAKGRPIYGLQGQGLDPGQQPHDCIEEMAAFYCHEIHARQPNGPYLLAGWSMGGLIALEMARQWEAIGQHVPLVALLDTHLSLADFDKLKLDDESIIRWIAPHLDIPVGDLKKLSLEQQWERIARQAELSDGMGVPEIRRLAAACRAHLAATSRYLPQPYSGKAVLFQAGPKLGRLDPRWKKLCPYLSVEQVPGNHYSMLRQPEVQVLADRLGRYLNGDEPLATSPSVSLPKVNRPKTKVPMTTRIP